MNIIKKAKYGKTRSEQESNLRKDGFSTMSNENLDKLKYLEKKFDIKKGFINQGEIERRAR